MSDADFQALIQAANESAAAHALRRATTFLRAACNTSWLARRLESGFARWHSGPPNTQARACLEIVAIATFAHVVLVLPVPVHARSALPLAVPLVIAAVALVAAFAIRPDRRR